MTVSLTRFLDELDPPEVGQPLIVLALLDPEQPLRAFSAIPVTIALTGAASDVGVVFPVEFTVTTPTKLVRRVFRRVLPSQVTYTPREGGEHLFRIAEIGHNLWFGALSLTIGGAPLTSSK